MCTHIIPHARAGSVCLSQLAERISPISRGSRRDHGYYQTEIHEEFPNILSSSSIGRKQSRNDWPVSGQQPRLTEPTMSDFSAAMDRLRRIASSAPLLLSRPARSSFGISTVSFIYLQYEHNASMCGA
jgi:hypothetical protein